MVLALLLLVAVWAVPLTVLVVPPIVLVDALHRSLAAVGLWLVAVALVVGWVRALLVDMDRVDATGDQGSWLAGVEWLLAAVVAATASVVVARRRGAVPFGTLTR
ncbi:hypothetical protein GCM10028783_18950 [Modestobacter muralis]